MRGYVGLAVASLAFALASMPAPVAVLFETNDQAWRAATFGTRTGTWDTIHHVPPTPVARHYYLAVRGVVISALAVAAFLVVTAAVTARSRAWGIRLHAVYVAAQVVLMVALLLAAQRFEAAMTLSAPEREWMLALTGTTSVYRMAQAASGFGLLYPVVLTILYVRLGKLNERYAARVSEL